MRSGPRHHRSLTRRALLRHAALALGGSLVGAGPARRAVGSNPVPHNPAVLHGSEGVPRALAASAPDTLRHPSSSLRMAERAPFANHVGWAYSCDIHTHADQMYADFLRMRDLGCTSLYIGHDNPASPNPSSVEAGLSFAVWYELMTHGPEEGEAQRKLAAIRAGVEASARAGLQVVLPIDYQVQMGRPWARNNPGELARTSDGGVLGGDVDPNASAYSPLFRADKRGYYEWVRAEFLQPYPHIVAINLGDEPPGSDYSVYAMRAFEARYGHPWESATDEERGEFQCGVLADYVAWSTWQWYELDPGLRTMFTFHIDRFRPFFPDFERTCYGAAPPFVLSCDTHLHDNPTWVPLTPQDRNLLFNLCRMLGLWSWTTGRDVMLWHSANRWGLNTGGVPEARDNVEVVLETTRNTGGSVAKLMCWGWNIIFQGLYRDQGEFAHVDKEEMLAAITALQQDAQPALTGRTEPHPVKALYVPSSVLHAAVGAGRTSYLFDHRRWVDLETYDFAAEPLVTLSDGPALEEVRRHGWEIVDITASGTAVNPRRAAYYRPVDAVDLHEGRLWFADTSHAATHALGRVASALRVDGLSWLQEVGLHKGSLFAAGPDRTFYEFVLFERAIFHAVADRFESTLVFRDIAAGRLELGEGNRAFFDLPQPVLDRLHVTPIIGDPGSRAPSFTALRPWLTLDGENQDSDRRGQPATDSIDAFGAVAAFDGPEAAGITYSVYDNGHNVPGVLFAEIVRRYGDDPARWWPRIGRPIGRAFWMESWIGAEGLRWVLAQPFERALLVYHPQYADRPDWVTQRSLAGNFLLKLLKGDELPYRLEFHERVW